jgi:hypothetical protein
LCGTGNHSLWKRRLSDENQHWTKFTETLRSLVAIRRDLFLLGRSQSGMALFSVLAGLIAISGVAQAATPAIDLKEAVDKFVQSIPGSKQDGYKDPTTDLIARTRLVEGFKKARNGQLSAARKQLALVNYTARFYVDSGTGREVVILQEQKDKGAYPRAWGLYVIAWPPKQNLSKLVVEVPHACPRNVPNVCEGGDTDSHLLGVEAFRSANAHYLFINGAQRNSTSLSDVAHQPESPFEKIHEAALDPIQMGLGAKAKVYQAHRFFTENHEGDPPPPVDNVKPNTGVLPMWWCPTVRTPPLAPWPRRLPWQLRPRIRASFSSAWPLGLVLVLIWPRQQMFRRITCTAARSFMWRQTSPFIFAAARADETNWPRQLRVR